MRTEDGAPAGEALMRLEATGLDQISRRESSISTYGEVVHVVLSLGITLLSDTSRRGRVTLRESV